MSPRTLLTLHIQRRALTHVCHYGAHRPTASNMESRLFPVISLWYTARLLVFVLITMMLRLQTASAQSVEDYAAAYSGFAERYPQERVYVSFDNTLYFKGENIYYKANVLADADLRPTEMSRIVYVELVSPNGWVVETHKHVIKDGGADGAFQLKDSLNAGFYEVRAYTAWMLNFCAANYGNALPGLKELFLETEADRREALTLYLKGNAGVFSRVFPIYERVVDGYYTNRQMYAVPKVTSDLRTEEKPKLELTFFPEGGNLIEGVPSRMAYEMHMSDGVSVKAMLRVMYQGKTVRTLFPTHEGRGVFVLPGGKQSHKDFSVEVVTQDKTYSFDLPEVRKQGFSLCVNNTGDTVMVRVSRNMATPTVPLGVAITCRGRIGHVEILAFGDTLDSQLKIPVSKLAEGVNVVTLYDGGGRVIAQREFFVRPRKAPLKVRVAGKTKGVKPYDRVDLDVVLTGNDNDTVRRSETFALAVTTSRDRQLTYDDRDIRTDLLLSSEIKGFVRNPQYYFEADDSIHNLALDLLMMVQGWTRYDFGLMTRPESFKPYFMPERSLRFRADVRRRNTDRHDKVEILRKPFWLECSLLPTGSSFGDASLFWGETEVRKTGTIDIELPPFYGFAHAYFIMSKKPHGEREAGKVDPHYVLINKKQKYYLEDDFQLGSRNAFPPLAKPYAYYEINVPDDYDYLNTIDSVYLDMLLPEVHKTARRRWSDAGLTRPNEVIDLEQIAALHGNIMGDIPSFSFTQSPFSWEEYTFPLYVMGVSTGGLSTYVNGYHFPTMLRLGVGVGGNIMPDFHYVFGVGSEEALPQGMEFIPRNTEFKSYSLFADFHNRDLIYSPQRYGSELCYDKQGLCTVKLNFNTVQKYHPGENIPDFFGHKVLVQGITPPVQFYSPDYSSAALPEQKDFRRTLYWNANVKTDADGCAHISFYNNSRTNDLHVAAEGISKDDGAMILY